MTDLVVVPPYTDEDVRAVAEVLREAGMVSAYFDDSSGSWEVEQKTWQYEGAAQGVLDALTAAGRLLPAEPVNDTEATGRCCCAGCVGMGPCDRAESLADDHERCENCAGTGTDSTLVITDPYPVYMPHPCGYCEPVKP